VPTTCGNVHAIGFGKKNSDIYKKNKVELESEAAFQRSEVGDPAAVFCLSKKHGDFTNNRGLKWSCNQQPPKMMETIGMAQNYWRQIGLSNAPKNRTWQFMLVRFVAPRFLSLTHVMGIVTAQRSLVLCGRVSHCLLVMAVHYWKSWATSESLGGSVPVTSGYVPLFMGAPNSNLSWI
jgi:hypothetical protein